MTATIAISTTVTAMTVTNKTIYLICGVSGAGKSWVCERIKHLAYYHSTDTHGYADPSHSLEIQDRTTNISSSIKRLKDKNFNVIPIFILGDFIQVKQQLVSRGGKITANLYYRWKRVKHLASVYGHFTGSSSEVLSFLKKELEHRDIEHTVYRVRSPSGKIYIGKTSMSLSKRKYDHEWLSKTKNSAFCNAIKKYGDLLEWEEIEKVKGLQAANERECFWIDYYKSYQTEFGYNQTIGGDGGAKNAETESKRIESIRRSLNKPESKLKLSNSSKKTWHEKREKMSASILAVRSTEESREKTRKQMEKQKSDPVWLAKISASSKEVNSKPEVKAKLSSSLKKIKAKSFTVEKDGKLIGIFDNQSDASVALKLRSSSISRCLGGFLKQTGGYTFRYLDTDSIIDRMGESYEEYNESDISSSE